MRFAVYISSNTNDSDVKRRNWVCTCAVTNDWTSIDCRHTSGIRKALCVQHTQVKWRGHFGLGDACRWLSKSRCSTADCRQLRPQTYKYQFHRSVATMTTCTKSTQHLRTASKVFFNVELIFRGIEAQNSRQCIKITPSSPSFLIPW